MYSGSSAFFTQLCTHTQPASAQQARSWGILRVVCREVFAERPLSLHRPLMHYEVCILAAPTEDFSIHNLRLLVPKATFRQPPQCLDNDTLCRRRLRRMCQSSPMEEPIPLMEKQLQCVAPSPAHREVCATSCLDPSLLLKRTHPLQGHVNKPNTGELSGIVESLQFPMPLRLVLRDSRVCIFFDSQHAADVCLGSVRPRTNVRHAGISQQFLLQVQTTFSLTLRHADHAAALGALGLVSNHHLNVRLCLFLGSTLPVA